MAVPVVFGQGAYRRQDAQLPAIEVVNYYAERSPLAPGGVIWIPRPGLRLWALNDGPLRGLYCQEGTLGGDVLAVVGDGLFRYTVAAVGSRIGDVGGTGRVSIAGNLAGVMIATGAQLLYCTGGAPVVLTIPFTNPVSVAYLAGYWLCADGATQRRFYASDTDPTNWNPLNFDSASEQPDPIVAVISTGGRLWDFGKRTVEFRYPTGNFEAPFAPETGRSYQRGALARDTIVAMDNSCIWVGDDRIVYRGGEVPEAMSDAFLSEMLGKEEPSALYAWGLAWQGHVFYCLTIGQQGTYVLDLTTGQWSQWQSYGVSKWLPGIGCTAADGFPVVGDVDTGTLYRLDAEVFQDAGQPLRSVLTGGVRISADRARVASFRLDVVTGQRSAVTLDDPEAVLEVSRDAGNSWTSQGPAPLFEVGDHNRRVMWRMLGQFEHPGPLFKVIISDPVPRRISGAYLDGRF